MNIDELKPNDKILVTNSPDCIPVSARKVVKRDKKGLYVSCVDGKHYLNGHVHSKTNKELIGVERAE